MPKVTLSARSAFTFLLIGVFSLVLAVTCAFFLSEFWRGESLLAAAFADEVAQGENAVNTDQLPDSSFIYDTSIADLSGADAYFDGQTVQITGEAIGDNIEADKQGRFRWITLSSPDDSYTISVYVSAEAAAKIDSFGAYGKTGSIVQVRGTYHLACPEHDGMSDVHAEVLTVVEPGKEHHDYFEVKEFALGLETVTVGLFLCWLFYYLRERQR